MPLKIWLDGKLVDKENAKISVYDHGLLYGDGVFEGIRVYHGRIFQCEAHLKRLWDSARAIRLSIPHSSEQLRAAMEELIKVNSFTDCYIRLVVTRGAGYLGLNPSRCPVPSVFIIADSIEMYPPKAYEEGIAIITSTVVRNHANTTPPRVKSLNYLNNILAKIEAADAGVPEAVMLNLNGNVAECTADNIFIIRNGEVQTPGTSDGILEGITRQVILDMCKRQGLPCAEKTIQRHDLYVAEECFLTGTGAEVVPVTRIDGRPIGEGQPGPITRRLMEGFHQLVRGK